VNDYYVSIPIAGRILIEVTASSDKDALSMASAKYAQSAGEDVFDVEWEAYETIGEATLSRLKYKNVKVICKGAP